MAQESLDTLLTQLDSIQTRLDAVYAKRDSLLAKSAALSGRNINALLSTLAADPNATIGTSNADVDALNSEIALLETACVTLRDKISERQEKDHLARVKKLVPAHNADIATAAETMVKLHGLFKREQERRDGVRLATQYFSHILRPMQAPFVGWLDDKPHSGLSMFLRECVDNGILTGREPWLKDRNYRYITGEQS